MMDENAADRKLTEKWAKWHALAMILSSIPVYVSREFFPLLLGGIISFMMLCVLNKKQWLQFGYWGGPANVVTSVRLLLVWGMLAGCTVLSQEVLAVLGITVLLADGVDGYLARRFRTTSFFGGYYDMETDAYYVLVLCTILFMNGLLAGWILFIGLSRYAFVLIKALIPQKKYIQTRSFFGQFIAVFLMASLPAGLILPEKLYFPLIAVAGMMVAFSFIRELIWIIKANGSAYENA